MKSESSIYKAWKMNIYGIFVFVFVLGLMTPLLYLLLKEFTEQAVIRNTIMFAILSIYLVGGIDYIYNRIYLFKKLLNKEPMRCKVEDILAIKYIDSREENIKTKFKFYPIVRSVYDNRLYLAYGNYCLTNFTTILNYSNKENIYCTLYKSDGTPVRIGDSVDIYIQKTVNISVSIDKIKNKVKLKGKKFYYNHMNDKIDIDVFNEINFFKGVVDLDAGSM